VNREKIKLFKPIIHDITGTQTILRDDGKRFSALDYIYHPAKFTERQENFYHNLLRLYRLTGSENLPVYFSDGNGNNWRMDKGCVAMAVHDGFLKALASDSTGVVRIVTLGWSKTKG
jgi:hypothetical protein